MDKLSKILDEYIRKSGIENPILQNQALIIWDEIVGKVISEQTSPKYVSHRVLFIKTSNSVWRTQLVLMKSEILRKLNMKLKEMKKSRSDVIKDIRFI